MEWLLANPQIHSTFASLGTMHGDVYIVSDDCLTILEEINCKLSVEDHTLRTFRRAIGFGQNIKNDLIPLLINAKMTNILDATIRILVNLTVPIECLLSVDVMSRTEVGRHTIFELNKLLITSKESFTDSKSTKAIIDYMKNILDKDGKLTLEQCDRIHNCLLLLRNILHIPENNGFYNYHVAGCTSMQNQILWNLFTQSIDKMLIHLMSCTQRSYFGVTLVQLIALMYKDQHVSTLQKLLNLWFEASLSESSEDNESNTSPPKQCSGDSSPMLTSDPTSDSSDNGGSANSKSSEDRGSPDGSCKDTELQQFSSRMTSDYETSIIRVKPNNSKIHQQTNQQQITQEIQMQTICHDINQNINNCTSIQTNQNQTNQTKIPHPKITVVTRESSQSELSDCGYGTQVENQESISTSSNEDEGPQNKPIHQKPPCNQKQRFHTVNKLRSNISVQDKKEWRRKKLVKRSRSNIINMKGLLHHTPTDEDISNILKEFTVDFLLKGYSCLVQELHTQLLSDLQVQIDTSHFFWLVTYFLKFATQLELDLEHISYVLSYDIISYLTYEGVSLCEQLELATRQQSSDLKPYLRRMHLVVTAIREFLQALDIYKKITHLNQEDKEYLKFLQLQIAAAEDIKCLFILLLRRYNPKLQSKQYLQDLIVTNHILLMLLDSVTQLPEYRGTTKMTKHIKQFATVEIMHNYGLLLEDFRDNGEYVNDCIFTMMHHIGGDVGQVGTLFQPIILKTYSQIWENEYELCDDWSDLIEYVIHKFINKSQQAPVALPECPAMDATETNIDQIENSIENNWTQEEMDTLYWYYVQSKKAEDIVGNIIKQFNDNRNTNKSRIAVIQQLLQQDIIILMEYDELMKYENTQYERNVKTPTTSVCTAESGIECQETDLPTKNKPTDDIQVLRDRLYKENKGKQICWLQKVLLESCYVKLNINCGHSKDITQNCDVKVMEPVAYHCLLKKQSIPLVPWNLEQSNIMLDQPYMLLLHKLGFHLPVDAGKLFVRIPEFWTADILFNVAEKLGPINQSDFKFDVHQLSGAQLPFTKTKLTTDQQDLTFDHFLVPRSKQSNSIIRYTPEPEPSAATNWLQIVMRSKNINESIIFGERFYSSHIQQIINKNITKMTMTTTTTTTTAMTTSELAVGTTVTGLTRTSMIVEHSDDNEDNLMSFSDCSENELAKINESDSDEELGSPQLEVNDVVSNCETASVASDLTRMYVSDEEDKTSTNI